MGSLEFFLEPERREVLPSIAISSAGVLMSAEIQGDEAAPERLGVERGEDVAQMVVRRRAVLEGKEPPQERELGSTEAGDVREAVRPGDHRQQAEQQYLVERIGDLAALPRVRHLF